jgi:endo-1,4-beta-mannosidase
VDKEKVRDYSKFTNAQKIGIAFSALLGPVGPIVAYFAIKSHNESARQAVKNQVEQSLLRESITEELAFLSKTSPSKEKGFGIKKVEEKSWRVSQEIQDITRILKKDDSKETSYAKRISLERNSKVVEKTGKAKSPAL